MFTPSGNNEHSGFDCSSDVEDKDDVDQQFDTFSQHDEKSDQEKVVQQNGNGFATDLQTHKHMVYNRNTALA